MNMMKATCKIFILLIPIFFISQTLIAQHQDNTGLQLAHRADMQDRTLAFNYTGLLAEFKNTKFLLVYFQDQKLHVQDVTDLKFLKKSIRGTLYIPQGIKAFGFSLYNPIAGHDNNNGKGYIYEVYNKSHPVKGALYYKSLLLTSGYVNGFPSEKDYKVAIRLQDEAFSLYPELKKKHILIYLKTLAEADTNSYHQVKCELKHLLNDSLKENASEKSLRMISNLFGAMHRQSMKDSVMDIIVSKYPEGITAASEELSKINKATNTDSLVMLVEKFKREFNHADLSNNLLKVDLSNIYDRIAISYFREKDYCQFLYYESLIPLKDLEVTELVRFYTHLQLTHDTLALPILRRYANEAMHAITMARKQKPADRSQSGWDHLINLYYPCCVEIAAVSAYKDRNLKRAIQLERSILPFNDGYTGNFNLHYLEYIQKSGNKEKLLEEAAEIYTQNKPCPGIDSILRTAYYMRYGKDSSRYTKFTERLDNIAYLNRIKNLKKNMLNILAPLFTLKDMKGSPVSLSDLKGKVVVLDFWATWCVPCIHSFVGMNSVISKYKNDKNVVCLFIDGDESTPDRQTRVEKVKRVLSAKHYKFYVLLDKTKGQNVASLYHIDAIPARVVIDKNGFIQFQDKGYSGDPEKLEQELSTKINILENR